MTGWIGGLAGCGETLVLKATQPLVWHKSTRSAGGECVEVSIDENHVYVRDSKAQAVVLSFDRARWAMFLSPMRTTRFPSDPCA
ncbi:DUF397 domain-containing protein [Plantactinospora sp. WMMB782]|uniref:DUF397 domain-containing protein n=1 Tax=Plantactinospora sp. WMMB782 TaxID=3404121 RepID=UPI003B94E6AC